MEFDLSKCIDRISYLAMLRDARRYLEIGVRDGTTFFAITLPFKVAVDPVFAFEPKDHVAPGISFHALPSNIFFRKLKVGELDSRALQFPGEAGEKPLFDLIFIDGLHTFEQSYRDFTNSLDFAHNDTLWILDDTVPCDEYSAIPNEERSFRMRGDAGLPGKPWHGDVYKTVMAIHDFHPDYSYCTMMGGNPQTVVWRANPSTRRPVFGSTDVIQRLSYHDLLRFNVLLMPSEDERLPDLVGKSLNPVDCENPNDNALTRRLGKIKIRK